MALAQVQPAVEAGRRPTEVVTLEDEFTLVRLDGEFDLTSILALAEALNLAISFDRARVVIDLSGVQFMGAETIGVLVRSRNILQTRARAMTLRSPAPCVQRVLDLCELGDFVPTPELPER